MNADKETKSEKKKKMNVFMCVWEGGERRAWRGGTITKTICETVKRGKI